MAEHAMEALANLTAFLKRYAHDCEIARAWPQASLEYYGSLSGWGWGVARTYRGIERSSLDRLNGYVALARGDMSTALFITQHEGAVDLISTCENGTLRAEWLPKYASGEALTTIGYSQLTTSRQGGAPAMRADLTAGGYLLNGAMPWVTGAPFVTNVACGAALDDGRQLLALVALDAPGIQIQPAQRLAGLNSTHTCEVLCQDVFAAPRDIIAGPVNHLLSQRSALRLLLVSATGVGLSLGILDELDTLAATPGYGLASESHREIRAMCQTLHKRVEELARDETLNQSHIDGLRIDVDDWLVRLAGILMVAAKGSGYRRAAVAQRLATEAMFFCVWSASGEVRASTIARLLQPPSHLAHRANR